MPVKANRVLVRPKSRSSPPTRHHAQGPRFQSSVTKRLNGEGWIHRSAGSVCAMFAAAEGGARCHGSVGSARSLPGCAEVQARFAHASTRMSIPRLSFRPCVCANVARKLRALVRINGRRGDTLTSDCLQASRISTVDAFPCIRHVGRP